MAKKVLKGFVCCVIVLTLAFFFLKDHLLRMYLARYLAKNFQATCNIKKIHLSFSGITITDFTFTNDIVEVTFNSGYVSFRLYGISRLSVSKLYLQDAACTIKNFPALRSVDVAKKTGKQNISVQLVPITIDLRNVRLSMNDKRLGAADIQFSLRTHIGRERITLEHFEITDCNIHSSDVEANHITLRKIKGGLYVFRIPMLRLKQKEFNDLVFPLKMEKYRVLFPITKNIIFGRSAYASGEIDLRNANNFCLQVGFRQASLENVVALVAGEENVSITGGFDGTLALCFEGDNLKKLEGNFSNQAGGLIHIKKEASLEFLRGYLDQTSYDALVDNLKNYEYNKGVVHIGQGKDAVSLEMNFFSESMGKRSVTINFHNSAGGLQ
ncbi:MAG: YdbH domain-containing protein [Candidatus Omnitrophota bacterium]